MDMAHISVNTCNPMAPSIKTRHVLLIYAAMYLQVSPVFASTLPDNSMVASRLEAAFQPIRYDWATLSPDGTYVAYLSRSLTPLTSETGEFRYSVIVRKVDDPDTWFEADGGRRINFLGWTADNRLLYISHHSDIKYAFPQGALTETNFHARLDENLLESNGEHAAEVHSVNVLNQSDRLLATASDSVGIRFPLDQRTPTFYLRENGPALHTIVSVNANTGSKKTIAIEAAEVSDWFLIDKTGVPRIQLSRTNPQRVLYSDGVRKPWRDLDRIVAPKIFQFETTALNYFGPHELPLAISCESDVFYYASNAGRSTFAVYSVELKSWMHRRVLFEKADVDLVDCSVPFPTAELIWDRFAGNLVGTRFNDLERETMWSDPELQEIQHEVSQNFTDRSVDIIDWDRKRSRFLLLISSGSGPGRYYIFDRESKDYVQFLRQQPDFDPGSGNLRKAFSFVGIHGRLSGYITDPSDEDPALTPVVLVLHGGPWKRFLPGFDRDALALSEMGFTVVELNYTGSAGFGLVQINAIQAGLDQIPIDDILSTIKMITPSKGRELRKVFLMGEGFGGYLALRAVQVSPESFNGAIVLNPILDLANEASYLNTANDFEKEAISARGHARFFLNSALPLDDISAIRFASKTSRPVLFLQNPEFKANPLAAVIAIVDPADRHVSADRVKAFCNAIRSRGVRAQYFELGAQFKNDPTTRAAAFLTIKSFLDSNLRDAQQTVRR
jgi:pimeloyl-ACP methyl ester carboxylesterase